MSGASRSRRRAFRPSHAAGYDKTADRPVKGRSAVRVGAVRDGERVVLLDNDSDTEDDHATGYAIDYEAERPPHYGGD